MVAALAGCGGGGGGGSSDTTAAAPPAAAPAAPTVAAPTGTAPVTLTATTPAATFAALTPTVDAATGVSVSIASPPKVTFALTDGNGNAIIGFGSKSQSATATVASYPNVSFALAKLVPGANGAPSKWVSYIVTTVPTYKSATDKTVVASVPTRPTSDSNGTLVDNGNGTYTYTFYRDITKAKDEVGAATLTAPNVAADLGDLTYDANAVHRLTIQISGNAPGTGTNTADGVQVTAGVPMANPLNVIYDFIPATGKRVTDSGRDIVATAKCNECHGKLGGIPGGTASAAPATFHGGTRNDARYCMVCHTDQRRYGRVEATTTATGFDSTKGTYVVMGRAVGNMPNHIHKIHMGERLTKTGYNYANVLYNEVTYPQTIQNCQKCHDGTAGAANQTAQGDNWKNVPSRLACGACHDGINFATGKGLTLGDAEDGLTTSQFGHVGGAQADDKNCALCHNADAIPVYHVTVDRKGSADRGGYPVNTALNTPTPGFPAGQGPAIPLQSLINSPAGVFKMSYEIKQATVAGASGAKKISVVYRILKDGKPVTLNATGALIDNTDGSPAVMLAYAVPQDGIASPSDWNVAFDLGGGTTVKTLRDSGAQTGPDVDGYYTATLPRTIPDNATMVTVGMPLAYQGFVQLNHPDYPKGIRLRESKFVMKTADGYSARRAVVDGDKCNKCHGQLGVSPSFHSGARNNGAGCALCHNPNRATGHVGAAYGFGGGWFVGIKNLVHSIHASAKREQVFNYLKDEGSEFDKVTFPGILKNCETCHLSGTYDFSASSSSAALPNLLWATDTAGNMTNNATTNPTGIVPIAQNPWVKLIGPGEIDYRTDNLVSSPIASSCFGCHDSSLAAQHMQSNGGTLLKQFSTVSSLGTTTPRPMPTAAGVGDSTAMTFTKTEQCTLCHLAGKVADIKVMHAK